MKKKFLIVLTFICACMVLLSACGEREVMGVSVSRLSGNGSDKGVFRVTYSEDKVLEDKFMDVWIKSSEDELTLTLTEEFGGVYEISLAKKDKWYSLTGLIAKAEGKEGTEDYVLYKDAVATTYTVESEKDFKLTVKAVIGDKEENFEGTGYLLSNRRDVSKERELKVSGKEG